MSPAPTTPTANNTNPTRLLLELVKQLEYLGNQFSGSLNLAKGFIPLDIFAARFIDTNEIDNLAGHGGIMAIDSNPMLQRVDAATDKAARLEWNAADVAEIQFPPITKPPDFDSSQLMTFHGMFAKSADANTFAVDVQVFDGVGDTEMGGVTENFVQALAEYEVEIAAAGLSAHPGFFTISLIPEAHAGDILYLYNAWLEYTRI